MLSCDTIALKSKYSSGGQNLLAKNSDRPVGEAQPLVFIVGSEHPEEEMLACTHLTIPQVRHTYSVLGAKPYWIWGFEMGANEKGLFIGNEAQGSRCSAESVEGLLGMDILRLALERTATARDAISCIDGLLRCYGQNANASTRFDRRYENSFLLADPEEIWLMETAGREWVAKQVRDWVAVSNCYTIETDYDLCSEGMETLVRAKRWLSPHETVNFAKAYTLPSSRQGKAVPRWRRMQKLISQHDAPLTIQDLQVIFRDHFGGELISPRFDACHATFVSVCMHAQDSDSAQTAASMIFTRDETLGPVFRYAPSLPCCSVYLPVYWTGKVPSAMSAGGRFFDRRSLWWCVERLAMAVSIDEPRFGGAVRTLLGDLEKAIGDNTARAEAEAKRLIASGKMNEAMDTLHSLTEESAESLRSLAESLSQSISEAVRADGGLYGQRREFLEEYCSWARMDLA